MCKQTVKSIVVGLHGTFPKTWGKAGRNQKAEESRISIPPYFEDQPEY